MNIIELAKEAGGWEVDGKTAFYPEELERFAALVRAEREWVDLTDDELVLATENSEVDNRLSAAIDAIAAFKEKNK